LRLDRIHIVHQSWRAEDTADKHQTSRGYNDPTCSIPTNDISDGAASAFCSCRFQMNETPATHG